MTTKQLRAPALVTRNALGNAKLGSSCSSEFSARTHFDQSATAQMIARRFNVHPATALAHVEAFGFGGCR